MKTLTLEHLVPYLPYGLKARIKDFKCDYVGPEFDLIIGFHQWDKSGKLWSVLTEGGQNVLNFIQFREYKLLLEMHFDVFGIIEQGLAIDINTLNK